MSFSSLGMEMQRTLTRLTPSKLQPELGYARRDLAMAVGIQDPETSHRTQ